MLLSKIFYPHETYTWGTPIYVIRVNVFIRVFWNKNSYVSITEKLPIFYKYYKLSCKLHTNITFSEILSFCSSESLCKHISLAIRFFCLLFLYCFFLRSQILWSLYFYYRLPHNWLYLSNVGMFCAILRGLIIRI